MQLFDTHCHLDCEEFDHDRSDVIAACKASGIDSLLLPAITHAAWQRLYDLAVSDHMFVAAIGLHPYYIDEHLDSHLDDLAQWCEKEKVVAVGEIGLDFFVKTLDVAKQHRIFERQLSTAREANLPVVLHVRKAHDEVLKQLRRFKLKGGTVHAFSGSEQQARQYIDLGFKLGFGGAMTYTRANKLRRLAKELPLDAIVLETDAPDIPPASHNGERNSPVYLTEILQALADLRETSPEEIARQTTQNAKSVFCM